MISRKIILPVLISIIILVGYKSLTKTRELPYELETVKRGNVIQEVLTTGQITKGEEINLTFKNAGRIEEIYVKVGDTIEAGQNLARLETGQLKIQLGEAGAALKASQAKLNKLLTGASPEEIKAAQTRVVNAKNTYENAKQSLENAKALSEENLKTVYNTALNTLDDTYLKAYNVQNIVVSISRSSFEVGNLIKNDREAIETAVSQMKVLLDETKLNPKNENIDAALYEFETKLTGIKQNLENVRNLIEKPDYYYRVSSTDKTSLDTNKANLATALTSIINSRQTIATTKLTNQSNINTAEGQLISAEGAWMSAQDQLTLLTAEPQQVDIDLADAEVRQTEARVSLLKSQIEEATLASPIAGQITKIQKRAGETIQPMVDKAVISLMPVGAFQVEVDIPEVDIGKVKLGNACKISIDAFPEQEFSGRVIEIEPAETIISSVVYYKTKTSLDAQDGKIHPVKSDETELFNRVKPGMTANVEIITGVRENVLIIPQRAVVERNGKKLVRIPAGRSFEEKEIQIGLKGSDGEVEVISGLKEGDKVITILRSR